VALTGIAGVFCSVMIYHVTLRRFWAGWNTGLKFFGTAVLLGAATSATIAALSGMSQPELAPLLPYALGTLLHVVLFSTGFKLAHELSLLLHLGDKQQNELKRSALLLTHDLRELGLLRLVCGVLGGLILPAITLWSLDVTGVDGLVSVLSLVSLVLLVCGELLERSLFFAAVSAPRMPGPFA
jgi:DMSO reductase anchor subunit